MNSKQMTLDQELVNIAMSIIMEAGDARLAIMEALEMMEAGDFATSERKLEEARVLLASAHGKQTDIIQSEGEGHLRQHPLLFIHAQDTLMTINSELNLCKRMGRIFENYKRRLQVLETAALGERL